MMRTEKMEEHKIRKAVREIRTHLHVGKHGIWRVRNLLNFDPSLERMRTEHRLEQMRIRQHLARNEKARAANLSEETIMGMTATERQQWMRDTTDHCGRQTHIDTIFKVIDNARTTSVRQHITALDVIQTCTNQRHAAAKQCDITTYIVRLPGSRTQVSRAPTQAPTAHARKRSRPRATARKQKNTNRGYTKKRASARAPALAHKSSRKRKRPVAERCDAYNPVCEVCDKRANAKHSLKSCYSCNLSWHKECHPQLRNAQRAPAYWQCEECKAQEPHTPRITTHMAQTAAGSGSGTDITQEAQADTAHAEWVADTRADHEILSDSDDEDYEESQDDSSDLHRRKGKGKRTLHRKKRQRTILDDTDSETDSDHTDKSQDAQQGRSKQKRYDGARKKKRKK